MASVGLFFGSDTGNTEAIGKMIQKQLGKKLVHVQDIAKSSKEDIDKIYYKFECENWDVEDSLPIKKSRFDKLVEAIKLGDYYRIAKFVYARLPSTVKKFQQE